MASYNEQLENFSNVISQNNPLFKAAPYSQGINFGSTSTTFLKYTKLVPAGTGMINVRDEYSWRNSGDVTSTEEVPAIILEEKTLSMTGLAATVSNVANYGARVVTALQDGQTLTDASAADPYMNLYVIEDDSQSFKYKLPWLLNSGSNLRSISNTWNDIKGNALPSSKNSGNSNSGGSGLEKAVGMLGGLIAGAVTPGMEIDPIYTFGSTTPLSISLKFPLYNTFSVAQTIKNYYFTILLTYQNLKNRTSIVTYVPPSVYTVSCEGHNGVYMPVAIMRELRINNIGTVRQIRDEIIAGQTVLVPEAYEVVITLQELLPQSTNIFQGAIGGGKVNVFTNNPIGIGPVPGAPAGP